MINSTITISPVNTSPRPNSNGSATSDSSEDMKSPNYENMNLEDMLADKLDTSVLEKTRMFNPRKQRSCHKRAEPVSEECRKKESSKNSREYTKRNRDEIKVCQTLRNDLKSKKTRLQELVSDLKVQSVEKKVLSAVRDFEQILAPHFKHGADIRCTLRVPDPDSYMHEYRLAATNAENIQFTTEIDSHEKRLDELRKELGELENKKDNLASQKEKTNYASSKSRLKQRVIRAELKVECYFIWKQIESLKLRGAKLNECCNTLKEQIWENILSIYYTFSQSLKNVKNPLYHSQHLDRILKYFAPYSRTKEEPTTPQTKFEFEFTSESVPITPPSESTSIIQDSYISSTLKLSPFATTLVPCIPPTLVSPSFTLSLPTVSVPYISPQSEEKKPKELLLPVVTVTDNGKTTQILPEKEKKSDILLIENRRIENSTEEQDVEIDILNTDSNTVEYEVEISNTPSRKRIITPILEESNLKKMRSTVTPNSICSSRISPDSQIQTSSTNEPILPVLPNMPQVTPQLKQSLEMNTNVFTMLLNRMIHFPSTVTPSERNAFNSQLQIATWLQFLKK